MKKNTAKASKRPYNRHEGSNPPGRPPIYKTPEELQAAIEEYFQGGYRTRQVMVQYKNRHAWVDVPVITITGLVIFLGFSDRTSFYDYEKQEMFSYIIKRARTFIEREYEEQLQLGNVTGAIFALKNFGWHDRTDLVIDKHPFLHSDFEKMTKDDLQKEAFKIREELAGHLTPGSSN